MTSREDSRVETFFATGDDFEETLDLAEENAQRGHAADFLADLRSRWKLYGMRGYLSQQQYNWLKQLSGEED